jgi:hypothetical protein
MSTPVTTIVVKPPSSSELSRNASVVSTTSASSASSSSSASLIQPPTRPRPIRTYTGPQARNVPDVATSSPTTPRQSVLDPEYLNTPNGSANGSATVVFRALGFPAYQSRLLQRARQCSGYTIPVPQRQRRIPSLPRLGPTSPKWKPDTQPATEWAEHATELRLWESVGRGLLLYCMHYTF